MAKKVAVIDGNSLMHRAYHAVPPTMSTPDGTPTHAVFGFFSMLLKFIDKASPDALICAFDAGRPAWRMEIIEQYKATRPPMKDDLRVQFPLVEELLSAMNVPVVRHKGWEGDDVLGTIAARTEALGYETLLVSGDKDVYQLVSEKTQVVTTKKGISNVEIYGPEQVFERYGVTPEQFPDFLGLKGDKSDNIPGVLGIGDKSAANLLQRFGSLEGIYENLDEIKGRQLENLIKFKEEAFASRQVATIVRDLDFELDLEACSFPSFDVQKVTEAFQKVRFNNHLAHVLRLVGAEVEKKYAPLEVGSVVRGSEAQALIEKAGITHERVGVALYKPEQTSLFGEEVFVGVSTCGGNALFSGDEATSALAYLVSHCAISALDVKDMLRLVYPADSGKKALISDAELFALDAFDVGLAAYVLNSSIEQYSYDALLDAYCGGVMPEAKSDEDRAVLCAEAARQLQEALSSALKERGSNEAYFTIDAPLIPVLASMERVGVALDDKRLKTLGAHADAELKDLSDKIQEMAGESFNIDSPMQLSHILFEVMGFEPTKKNQRGFSTDASVLKELAKTHEMPAFVLRYRELAKMKSTYIDALPKDAANTQDGRIHTTFNETVTTTGRLSSSDPNLQNIPVRTAFGKKIRECFVPLAPGEVFLSADYSQIELRLLAHLSADEHLVAAFNSGADFHTNTAARIFGISPDEVTPVMRTRAKAVNFGIVYGQQAFGLAQSLDISFGEAKKMIDRYFEAYPGVRKYLDEVVKQASECGYTTTMYGRRRYIPELAISNAFKHGQGERTAMNHPMQGSAADIIKLAMTKVAHRLRAENFSAKLLLQVHDELDFSVPEDELERLSVMVCEVMENVDELRVPLVVDVEWGSNWAQAH